jgi:large subunit ribosomal protein L20
VSRVKRGNVSRKRHKKVLDLAKGFRGPLSKLYRPAHQAVLHALTNMYKDRRLKKRDFRALWIARISAALTTKTISYSKLIGSLTKKNVQLNRKVLADLAIHHPTVFDDIVNHASKG